MRYCIGNSWAFQALWVLGIFSLLTWHWVLCLLLGWQEHIGNPWWIYQPPCLNFPACFHRVTPAPSIDDELFVIKLTFLQKSPSSFYYIVFGKSQLHRLLVMQNWGNSCTFLNFNFVLNTVFDLSDLLYIFLLGKLSSSSNSSPFPFTLCFLGGTYIFICSFIHPWYVHWIFPMWKTQC